MKTPVLIWVLGWSLLSLLLMGADKGKAVRGKRRIPEKTLFLAAALGGSPGAIMGMVLFRHKTRHRSFLLGMPAILAAQTALLLFCGYASAFLF